MSESASFDPHTVLLDNIVKIQKGEIECLDLPWTRMDESTSAMLPGTVTMLCGDPGASKSFMLLQAIVHWFDAGYRVALFSLEGDAKFHMSRLIAQKAGLPQITDYRWIKKNAEQANETVKRHREYLDEFSGCMTLSSGNPPSIDQLIGWANMKASDGCRVIAIDPTSMARYQTGRPWEEDARLLSELGHIADRYSCSILLVTHPTKARNNPNLPDMSSLSGSAAYSRFSDTIFWLEAHDWKTKKIKTDCGTTQAAINRTIHILKARHGTGRGLRIGCEFAKENLMLFEKGIIMKEKKE